MTVISSSYTRITVPYSGNQGLMLKHSHNVHDDASTGSFTLLARRRLGLASWHE